MMLCCGLLKLSKRRQCAVEACSGGGTADAVVHDSAGDNVKQPRKQSYRSPNPKLAGWRQLQPFMYQLRGSGSPSATGNESQIPDVRASAHATSFDSRVPSYTGSFPIKHSSPPPPQLPPTPRPAAAATVTEVNVPHPAVGAVVCLGAAETGRSPPPPLLSSGKQRKDDGVSPSLPSPLWRSSGGGIGNIGGGDGGGGSRGFRRITWGVAEREEEGAAVRLSPGALGSEPGRAAEDGGGTAAGGCCCGGGGGLHSSATTAGLMVMQRRSLQSPQQGDGATASLKSSASLASEMLLTSMGMGMLGGGDTPRHAIAINMELVGANSPYATDDLESLQLLEMAGRGSHSIVFTGQLHGLLDVAVKLTLRRPSPPPSTAPGSEAGKTDDGNDGNGSDDVFRPDGIRTKAGPAAADGKREGGRRRALLCPAGRELSTMTTVSHPHIAQIYSYHMRVYMRLRQRATLKLQQQQEAQSGQCLTADPLGSFGGLGGGGNWEVTPPLDPRDVELVPLPADEDPQTVALAEASGNLFSVTVMEHCDLGSLAAAIDSGMFRKAIRTAASRAGMAIVSGQGGGGGAFHRSRSMVETGMDAAVSTTAASDGKAGDLETDSTNGTRSNAKITFGRNNPLLQLQGAASALSSASGGGFIGNVPAAAAAAISSSGSSRALAEAMRVIYRTLLEVALALRHMHSRNLVHCDLKPDNILLKSSPRDPRGFTCKLADFGFVTRTSNGGGLAALASVGCDRASSSPDSVLQLSGFDEAPGGTITHVPPEVFLCPDCKAEPSRDIYAFGILMWEVLTMEAPYTDLAAEGFRDLPWRVVHQGRRPVFPAFAPAKYRELAELCWSADPAKRPSASVVVSAIQRMLSP